MAEHFLIEAMLGDSDGRHILSSDFLAEVPIQAGDQLTLYPGASALFERAVQAHHPEVGYVGTVCIGSAADSRVLANLARAAKKLIAKVTDVHPVSNGSRHIIDLHVFLVDGKS